MVVKLYNTTSRNNELNKTLIDELEISNVKLKENCNILHPILQLSDREDILNFNYAYIPKFKRYYFVGNRQYLNNGIIELSLDVDVLQSFKSYIKDLNVITKRQKTLGNDDLIDDRVKLLNYPTIQTNITFPNGFIDSSDGTTKLQYVMITTGGDV